MADAYEYWNGFLNLFNLGDTRPRYINWHDNIRLNPRDVAQFRLLVGRSPYAQTDREWAAAATAFGPEQAAVLSYLGGRFDGREIGLAQLADPAVRARLAEESRFFIPNLGPDGARRFDAILQDLSNPRTHERLTRTLQLPAEHAINQNSSLGSIWGNIVGAYSGRLIQRMDPWRAFRTPEPGPMPWPYGTPGATAPASPPPSPSSSPASRPDFAIPSLPGDSRYTRMVPRRDAFDRFQDLLRGADGQGTVANDDLNRNTFGRAASVLGPEAAAVMSVLTDGNNSDALLQTRLGQLADPEVRRQLLAHRGVNGGLQRVIANLGADGQQRVDDILKRLADPQYQAELTRRFALPPGVQLNGTTTFAAFQAMMLQDPSRFTPSSGPSTVPLPGYPNASPGASAPQSTPTNRAPPPSQPRSPAPRQ